MGEKSIFEAYLLAVTPLGLLGGLHFYLDRPHMGILYMCTLGVFGIGYLVDIFRTPFLVKEANMKRLHKKDPTQPLPAEKSVIDAYLTWFPLGLFGLHHFYLKRPNWAFLYMSTVGLFAVGWIVDAFWMVSMVRETNRKLSDPECWIVDAFWMVSMVRETNKKLSASEYKRRKELKKQREKEETDNIENVPSVAATPTSKDAIVKNQDAQKNGDVANPESKDEKAEVKEKEMRAAVALSLSPLGLFGAHHMYLKRNSWGFLYVASVGLFGIGWIADWFRIAFLTKRSNAIQRGEEDKKEKKLDDAYVLWFPPWGIFGLHQFYLGRSRWGFLYMVTAGMFFLGWLLDACRLPLLVKAANERRISNESGVKADDVEANITPAADDYDDNSLTLDIGNEDEEGDENTDKDGQQGGTSNRDETPKKTAETGTN